MIQVLLFEQWNINWTQASAYCKRLYIEESYAVLQTLTPDSCEQFVMIQVDDAN